MPTMTMLIGPPACGKTTWREKNVKPTDDVLSTDDILESIAAATNSTYSGVFDEYIKPASQMFERQLLDAVRNNRDIVVDRTNLTINGRRRFTDLVFTAGYDLHAVVFSPPWNEKDMAAYLKRLEQRKLEGKDIPMHVINAMMKQMEDVRSDEPFKSVTYISSFV